jgi:hypothetical protein
MSPPRPILLFLLGATCAFVWLMSWDGDSGPPTDSRSEVAGARYRLDEAAAERSGARLLAADARRAPLRFAPSVAPGDRDMILAAVAGARPEARRLIHLVDGLTEVVVGPLAQQVAGRMVPMEPGYAVTIDLGRVARQLGPRGVSRVVLHELAHVVDHALVTDPLMAELDARIPAGFGCDHGRMGGCAEVPERFAETFAKWATGDLGVDLYVGYKVPPPSVPLATWGEPLARLGA